MFVVKKEEDNLSFDLLIKILENFHGQDFMEKNLVSQIEETVQEISEHIEDQDRQVLLNKKFKEFKALHSNGS